MKRFAFGFGALLAMTLLLPSNSAAQSFSFGGGGVGVQFGTGGGYYGPGYRGGGYNYGPGYRGGGYNYGPYRGYGPNYYGRNDFGRSRSSVGIYLGTSPYYYGGGPSYYNYRPYGYSDNYIYRNDTRQYALPEPNRSAAVPSPAARYPSSEILAVMNWRELGLVLREATAQLLDELEQMSTGPGWQAHLKLGELSDQFAADVTEPPQPEAVARLQEILAKYDTAAANPEYDVITRKPSFAAVRSALGQFTEPAFERTSRRLTQFHEDLESSLDELPTGAGWKEHLALPADHDDAQALAKALKRYQAVEEKEDYRAIARLAPFPATLEALVELNGMAANADTEQPPALPTPE